LIIDVTKLSSSMPPRTTAEDCRRDRQPILLEDERGTTPAIINHADVERPVLLIANAPTTPEQNDRPASARSRGTFRICLRGLDARIAKRKP
jgi:hypothetical protein